MSKPRTSGIINRARGYGSDNDERCSHCGADDWERHESQPDRWDEPGHDAYLECRRCSNTKPTDD
jgi:hypothetical protein